MTLILLYFPFKFGDGTQHCRVKVQHFDAEKIISDSAG